MNEVTDIVMSSEESEIWEEIVDFSVWEFCIEVHKATKLNYLHLDPALDPNWDENKRREIAENASGEREPDKFVCPKCQRVYTSLVYFGKHLGDHLDKETKENEEKETKNDTTANTGKKTSQKNRGQKESKKSNARGNSSKSSGEDSDIFKNMKSEEINQFLVEKCGVLTRSKRRCLANVVKCAMHTPKAKELVRQTYSKFPGDNEGNDQMEQDVKKGNLACDFP